MARYAIRPREELTTTILLKKHILKVPQDLIFTVLFGITLNPHPRSLFLEQLDINTDSWSMYREETLDCSGQNGVS